MGGFAERVTAAAVSGFEKGGTRVQRFFAFTFLGGLAFALVFLVVAIKISDGKTEDKYADLPLCAESANQQSASDECVQLVPGELDYHSNSTGSRASSDLADFKRSDVQNGPNDEVSVDEKAMKAPEPVKGMLVGDELVGVQDADGKRYFGTEFNAPAKYWLLVAAGVAVMVGSLVVLYFLALRNPAPVGRRARRAA